MIKNRLRSLIACCAVALASPLAFAAAFEGASLTEALQELQRQGLDLVFSSNVVRPDMFVHTEPSGSTPRETLDQLLAAHDLGIYEAEGGTLVVISVDSAVAAQPARLVGAVYSISSGQPLSGATVQLLEIGVEATTGSEGQFRFDTIPEGTYTAQAIHRGHIVERQSGIVITDQRPTEITFLLTPAPINEEQVVVTPSRVSLLTEQPGDFFTLDRDQLLALPHLGNDFFRALTLLPGVTSNDVTAQFHVRGGRRDETQILLDGQELYDTYHLKDFDSALSVVTPDTIERVDLSTGGFPVQFGDRMSGVLDMETSSPTGPPRGRVTLDILSASAGGSGAFDREQGSWIAQVRRGTTDFAGRIFGTDAPRYWDAFGKLAYQVAARHTLRLNLLHTDDKYEIEEAVDGDFKSFQTNYRGSYLWLTHLAILGSSTFLDSAASVTRIDRDRNGLELEEDLSFAVRDLRDMEVLGVRQGWSHQLQQVHTLRWGFQLRDFDTEFDYRSEQRLGGELSIVEYSEPTRESHLGLYLSDSWQTTETLELELGLRYDNYTLTGEGLLSPRLNLLHSLGRRGMVRFALGQFNQSQRPYELQVEDGERDFFPVERSEQVILGYETLMASGRGRSDLAFRAEAYYRNVGNPRARYENLYEPLNTFPEVEPDRIRIAPGRSRAMGIELFLRGRAGRRLGWWVNYTYSSTEDLIDETWIPRRYDQAHAVNLDVDYRIGPHWRLNLAGRFHTGWPITPVFLETSETENGELEYSLGLGPLNSERLPAYRRLDLRASRSWDLGFGRLTFFADIQNLLNHRNAAGLDIIFDEEEGSLTVNQEYWVGFFPSLGIIFDF